MKEPVGHDQIRAMLRSLAERSAADGTVALHHAWLFAGPPGVGKFRVARWWASLLKCPQAGRCDPPCESCRLVASAVHPDVFETGPAPKDKNATVTADQEIERASSVKIAQSRELLQRISLRPARPGPRIAIVREAAAMTVEAQNALLKILEEPPGSAVLILVTDNIGSMLTTVRSRCRHLAFGSLSTDEVRLVLTGLGKEPAEAEAAAAASHGSVARALVLDADGLAERESILAGYEDVRRSALAIEPFVAMLAQKKDRGFALADILEWQLAKVEASLGRRGPEPSEKLSRILDEHAPAAGDRDPRQLIAEAERIQRTIDAIERNANAKLVIRDLLMNVRMDRAE